MAILNFSNSSPAAPAGNTNVTWQVDGLNNVSAYITTPATLAGSNLFTGSNTFTGAVSGSMGGWISWTPNVTPGGSMTYSGTVNEAKYWTIGPTTYFKMNIGSIILGGTASNTITISLPAVSVGLNTSVTFNYYNGSSFSPGFGFVNGGTANLVIQPAAGANFTLGSAEILELSGFYQTT